VQGGREEVKGGLGVIRPFFFRAKGSWGMFCLSLIKLSVFTQERKRRAVERGGRGIATKKKGRELREVP